MEKLFDKPTSYSFVIDGSEQVVKRNYKIAGMLKVLNDFSIEVIRIRVDYCGHDYLLIQSYREPGDYCAFDLSLILARGIKALCGATCWHEIKAYPCRDAVSAGWCCSIAGVTAEAWPTLQTQAEQLGMLIVDLDQPAKIRLALESDYVTRVTVK